MCNAATLPNARNSKLWFFLVLPGVALAVGCGPDDAAAAQAPGHAPVRRVLFVGNSLTAGNDLPLLVQAMAAAAGKRLLVDAVTPGGFSLEDHWNEGSARKKLAAAKWDFVVLQQGPSSRPESQANLKEWAKRWGDEIRKNGARPCLYMVWPFQNQSGGFAQVSQSYRTAAKACDGTILPAGDAWRDALREDADAGLYQADRLHPTPAGSYLAALVITHGLADIAPAKVPTQLRLSNGRRVVIPEKQAELLRRVAAKLVES